MTGIRSAIEALGGRTKAPQQDEPRKFEDLDLEGLIDTLTRVTQATRARMAAFIDGNPFGESEISFHSGRWNLLIQRVLENDPNTPSKDNRVVHMGLNHVNRARHGRDMFYSVTATKSGHSEPRIHIKRHAPKEGAGGSLGYQMPSDLSPNTIPRGEIR